MPRKITKKPQKIKSLAVLCSGGDAPGMNAALRAVVRYGIHYGLEVHGISKGYSGLLEGNFKKLGLRSVANIIQRGGTIIKTDRCEAFFKKEVRAEAVHILRRKEIDALVVIGGDGSFTGAHLMESENGFPTAGVPGTIDNDIFGSEYTIGFDTAVNTALDAIDKIRDTASAHDRVFLVEVMGRTSTEIATRVGVSGGAETILIPHLLWKKPKTAQETKAVAELGKSLVRSSDLGKLSSIVVVAESGHAGATYRIGKLLKKNFGIEAKVAILGHIQRGGSPSAMDRFMASLMGAKAVELLLAGKSGVAVGMVAGKIAAIPYSAIIGKHKPVDQKLLELAEILAS